MGSGYALEKREQKYRSEKHWFYRLWNSERLSNLLGRFILMKNFEKILTNTEWTPMVINDVSDIKKGDNFFSVCKLRAADKMFYPKQLISQFSTNVSISAFNCSK